MSTASHSTGPAAADDGRSPRLFRGGALAAVVLAVAAGAWALGTGSEGGDEPADAAALWDGLRTSIDAADYDAFLTCFTEENQGKLGTDDTARRRFHFAVDDLVEPQLLTGGTTGDVAEGRLRVQILGDALPKAIGMPADPASGLLVDVLRTERGWVIADARPTKPLAQPGGDPVERSANGALLELMEIDRLAHVLNDADTTALSRDQYYALSRWMDGVREAGVPPQMHFELDPSRYDAESVVWAVDVAIPSLATALEAPDARLALVLGPRAEGSAPGREPGAEPRDGPAVRWRVVEARLIPSK